MADKRSMDPREGNEAVAKLAEEAIASFKADAKDAFAALVEQYEGASATIGVFGMGAVSVSVAKGEVHVNPDPRKGGEQRGTGAISPEALVAIAEGRMTVLDAYHRGEIVVRAASETLHQGYDSFVKHSESALKSKRLQKTLEQFRKLANV